MKMFSTNHSNSTSTTTSAKDVGAGDIILVTFAILLSVFIVSVNSITIFVIRRTQHLHTLSNIYIVSLAGADMVVGLGLLPLSVFYIPFIRNEYYDQNVNLCVFVLGINLGMAVVSTIHMTLIATDRYLYIMWPYVYLKIVRHKVIYVVLCCTWMFGIFYAFLPQIIHNDASKVSKCDITMVMPIGYLFYSTASLYMFCVIIDVVLYSQILLTANRQRRMIRSTSLSTDSCKTENSFSDSATDVTQHEIMKPVEMNDHARVQTESNHFATSEIAHDELAKPFYIHVESDVQLRRNSSPCPGKSGPSHMKSVKFFMTVFGVYFICLTPTVACMGIDYYLKIPRIVYNMFNLLALLNSGMNFIIFCLLNARFRMSVLSLLRCRKVAKVLNASDAPFFDT